MAGFDRKAHWEQVYAKRKPQETSWFQANPATSLALIRNAGVSREAPVIDIGGGASLLVDHLLEEGYEDVTVLDISAAALERARDRLGVAADRVRWIESDITCFTPDRHYALWHDRAAFHFLTRPSDRENYVRALLQALPAEGQAIIATFALDGPQKCSGLDVVRYGSDEMQHQMGPGMELLQRQRETHTTPGGGTQHFVFFRLQRAPNKGMKFLYNLAKTGADS